MQLLNYAQEFASIGEVISGSKEEKTLVNKLKSFLEEKADEIVVHNVPVMLWKEKHVSLNIIDDGEIWSIGTLALPYTTSTHIVGDLVYVRNFGFSKIRKNVEGKIILTEWAKDPDEVEHQYLEALEKGALAIILYDRYPSRFRRIVVKGTYGYSYNTYTTTPIPAFSIRRENGIALAREALNKKLKAELFVEVNTQNAYGQIVEAIFNGKREDEKIYTTAHHDHWLTGFTDNILGVASLVSIANEAINWKLAREMRILSFTAEEGGSPGFTEWYWLYGSRWYLENVVVKRRVENEIYAVINWDAVGKGKLTIAASGYSFRYFIRKVAEGFKVKTEFNSSYFDSYTFSKIGIPSATINTMKDLADVYHTDKDTVNIVDKKVVSDAYNIFRKIVTALARDSAEIRLEQERVFLKNTFRNVGVSVNIEYLAISPRKIITLHKPIHRGNYREEYHPFETHFIPEVITLLRYCRVLEKAINSILEGNVQKALKLLAKIPSEIMLPGDEKSLPIAPIKSIIASLKKGHHNLAVKILENSVVILRRNAMGNLREILKELFQ